MRLLAGLPLLRPATPPPPPSLWTVWSTSHHAALVRVSDTLRTIAIGFTWNGVPDEDSLIHLGAALDAAEAVNGPGGVPCHLDGDEARRLIEASDLGKTLLQQLRAMLTAPNDNHHRDLWERRVAATLGELARVLPLTP